MALYFLQPTGGGCPIYKLIPTQLLMKCEGRREKSKIIKMYLLFTLSQKGTRGYAPPNKKKKIQQGYKNPKMQHKR